MTINFNATIEISTEEVIELLKNDNQFRDMIRHQIEANQKFNKQYSETSEYIEKMRNEIHQPAPKHATGLDESIEISEAAKSKIDSIVSKYKINNDIQ